MNYQICSNEACIVEAFHKHFELSQVRRFSEGGTVVMLATFKLRAMKAQPEVSDTEGCRFLNSSDCRIVIGRRTVNFEKICSGDDSREGGTSR